jgi:putative transposase
LEVSPSGYYARRKRAPSKRSLSDAALGNLIEELHRTSGGTYGVPRIHADLADKPYYLRVGRKRVARLMRERRLVGAHRRRWVRTTVKEKGARPAADLVERKFTAVAPNELWVADITYIPTWTGFRGGSVCLDSPRGVVKWIPAVDYAAEFERLRFEVYRIRREPVECLMRTAFVVECDVARERNARF